MYQKKTIYLPKSILTFQVIFFLFISIFHHIGYSQNITYAEYFIDSDPGFGNGTPITFTPGEPIDINFLIDTNSPEFTIGYHNIYIRVRDENGIWSMNEARPIVIKDTASFNPSVPYEINKLEYFIDNDPGHGNATDLSVPTGQIIDINDLLATGPLSDGIHLIGFRAKTTGGCWGITEYRPIFIKDNTITEPTIPDVTAIEYFFDTDPGLGQAIPLPSFSQGASFDINEILPETDQLAPGLHTLVVRAKNAYGHWGLVEKRPVIIKDYSPVDSAKANITRIEYFIDGVDPGVGKATAVSISPDTVIDLDPVLIPTEPTLIDGEHTITFRAMNEVGTWGLAETDTFDVWDNCEHPIAAFTPQIACAGQPIIFSDSSTNVYPTAEYRWYLNGDAIVDDTTPGDVSYTYSQPGTYVVALAIRQGTICFDSVTTTIDVQPLPFAIFSTTGNIVDKPVYFSASASNLPAGAFWSWDFDGDGVVDDNTEGNTNFTYTAVGTYNPTLTISDSLGCESTITNSVAINNAGTGEPLADFLAGNGCIGSTISFVDLSQYIPNEAVYSWDFDGDGTEDSALKGNPTFTYVSSGSYNATLSIDLGGSSIIAAHTIEIVDIPKADFSAISVCEGSAMVFNDLSTDTNAASVYMWDFNNDGIIDSNAKTDIFYTYSNAGTHVVSLTISNGYGCEQTVVKQVDVISKPVADFSWDIACAGDEVVFREEATGFNPGGEFQWDFDSDGTVDATTDGDTEHIFLSGGTYNVTLTVANPAQCSNSITKSIEIIERPITDIEVIAQCYGQESQMMDLSANVSPGAQYSWDFNNDGLTDDTTVGSTAHTYTSYDSYIVNLTIDNGGNCSSSAEFLVNFTDAASPDFELNQACEDEEVIFTDLSTDLDVGATYSWDFNGDGFEDSAFPGSTAFIFSEPGQYDATLTIDNGGQCLAHKTISVDVTPPPSVDLGPDQYLCVEGTVTLDAGAGYASYLWTNGSTEQTYIIDQIGDYMVRVQDVKGCSNTDTISIQLLGDPIPSFEYSIELSLEGIQVSFINTSDFADSYAWNFGDENTSTDVDPVHIYTDFSFYETSVYQVCLTGFNQCNRNAQYCEDIFLSPTQFMNEGGELFSVYPNPADQSVYLDLKGVSGFNKVGLFDAYGKKYWEGEYPVEQFEVDLNEFSKGVYFFIVERNNSYLYKRIMKN